MDQRRWLEGVIRTFAAQVRGGPSSKVLVDERHQFVTRLQVTPSPGSQHSTDIDRPIQATPQLLRCGRLYARRKHALDTKR